MIFLHNAEVQNYYYYYLTCKEKCLILIAFFHTKFCYVIQTVNLSSLAPSHYYTNISYNTGFQKHNIVANRKALNLNLIETFDCKFPKFQELTN